MRKNKNFVTRAMGMPKDCRGLFNWGNGHKNPRDLDENFVDSDEYAEEIRRLCGDVMPKVIIFR